MREFVDAGEAGAIAIVQINVFGWLAKARGTSTVFLRGIHSSS